MAAEISRRGMLTQAAFAGLVGNSMADSAGAGKVPPNREPFVYSFNTSTVRGQNLPITAEVDIAAKAGYGAIEPWINELERYTQGGGNLRDLGRRITDAGLRVESAIGFCEWIVDDEGRRRKGLEDARRAMAMVRQIGGRRLAAPPVGATRQADLSLVRAAERRNRRRPAGRALGPLPLAEPPRGMRPRGHRQRPSASVHSG